MTLHTSTYGGVNVMHYVWPWGKGTMYVLLSGGPDRFQWTTPDGKTLVPPCGATDDGVVDAKRTLG